MTSPGTTGASVREERYPVHIPSDGYSLEYFLLKGCGIMPIVTLEYEKEGRQEKLQFFPHPDHIFRHALQGSDEVIFVFELAYGRLLNGLSSGGPYVQVYLQLNVKYDVVVSGEVTTFPIQF